MFSAETKEEEETDIELNKAEHGPLYVNKLADLGLISDPRFSFSHTYTGTPFVDFGPPQKSAMTSEWDIRYVMMEEDFFWSAFTQGIAFNTTENENSFGFSNGSYVYSTFDTGSSGVLFSADYFDAVIARIYDMLGTSNYAIT